MMKKIFGRLSSNKKQNNREEEKTSDIQIDKCISDIQSTHQKSVSLLLLGITGSGKSIVLKQMEAIYNDSISHEKLKEATCSIKQNILEDIYDLSIQNMICSLFIKQLYLNLFIPLGIINIISRLSKESQIICTEIVSLKHNTDLKQIELTPDLATKISLLWNDIGLQEIFNIYKCQYIMDNTPYFFENIDKISSPEYIADVDDYIRFRHKTTDIIEQTFNIGVSEQDMWKFRVIDVGGHREGRGKWAKCLVDINTIIYVMALDGYDKTLFEDNTSINCYRESLDVFERTMKDEALTMVDVFVFFNKNDLFTSKIKEVPFSVFEPDFNPDDVHNGQAVKEYLRDEFKKRFYNGIKPEKSLRRIHFYVTCCTDTDHFQTIMHLIQFETARRFMRVS